MVHGTQHLLVWEVTPLAHKRIQTFQVWLAVSGQYTLLFVAFRRASYGRCSFPVRSLLGNIRLFSPDLKCFLIRWTRLSSGCDKIIFDRKTSPSGKTALMSSTIFFVEILWTCSYAHSLHRGHQKGPLSNLKTKFKYKKCRWTLRY